MAVGHLTTAIRNAKLPGTLKTAEALDTLDGTLDSLSQTVGGIQSTIASLTPGSPGSTSLDLQLEVAVPNGTTTNINAVGTPTTGDQLVLFLNVDSTGGGQITWDASFKGISVNDIDNLPSTNGLLNAYTFRGRSDNKWWCIATKLGMDL